MMQLAKNVLIGALLAFQSFPAFAAPQLRAAKPTAPQQFKLGVSKIPAGSIGEFVVIFASQGPTSALPIEENKQVWVPVAGQVGAVTIPSGSMLVGRFARANETSGNFVFDSLVINGNVYKIQAASAPIPGKLRVDPYSLQTPRDSKDLAASGVGERRGYQQGAATREYAAAGGGLLGLATGSWQGGLAVGLLGSIVGTAQQTDAVNQSTNKQEAVLNRDIPSVMVTELAPLQSLNVQFQSDVSLDAPVAKLPQGVQPGMMTLQNAPVTPATAYPGSPVGPYPTYAQPGYYPTPQPSYYPTPVPGTSLPYFPR